MIDPETDPFGDMATSRVVIVAGKGGVGKTTVTAVLARNAARSGRRVLVVELDGKPTLDSFLVEDQRSDAEPLCEVRHLSASQALEEYLLDHGFRRIAQRLVSTGVIEVVGTAAPGIHDLVVLGRIKQLEQSGAWDVIVVDGPAAGHAVTMLTSASGLHDAVGGGPVRAQADDVISMLTDPARSSVVLVTLPETTPVNELIETASHFDQKVGIRIAAIVVNNVITSAIDGDELPDPRTVDFGRKTAKTADDIDDETEDVIAAAEFQRRRAGVQRAEIERVVRQFSVPPTTKRTSRSPRTGTEVSIVALSSLPTAALTPADLDQLDSTARVVEGDR